LSAGDPWLVEGGSLPDLLVVELLAQAAACMAGAREGGEGHLGYLTTARGWSFKRRARAGETLRLEARARARLGKLRSFTGEASVDGVPIADGELTCVVHF